MTPNPKPDLSHAFIGANPDEHRLSRVLMVGAFLGGENLLSPNDDALLRHALRVFHQWHLPVAEELENMREYRAQVTEKSVHVINILPEHGGKDFLQSREKGDVVILCNIARDVDDAAIRKPGNMAYAALPPSLRAAFSSSPDHNDIKAWQRQIEATDAKIVMVTNTDGFSLPELNNGKFAQVSLGAGDGQMGMLVRRDYLAHVENYLLLNSLTGKGESPLLDIAVAAERSPDARFRYNLATRKAVEYSGPR